MGGWVLVVVWGFCLLVLVCFYPNTVLELLGTFGAGCRGFCSPTCPVSAVLLLFSVRTASGVCKDCIIVWCGEISFSLCLWHLLFCKLFGMNYVTDPSASDDLFVADVCDGSDCCCQGFLTVCPSG